VIVEVEVLVNAGNINVIAGNGASVVVGVCEAEAEGVNVLDGVPDVGDGVCVGVGVPSGPPGVLVLDGVADFEVGVKVVIPLVGGNVARADGEAHAA